MENYHIFKVIPIPEGRTTPAMVKIQSQRHNQSVTIPNIESTSLKTAIKYLQALQYDLVGEGEGILNKAKRVKESFLISTTFKPLK